MQCAVSSEFRFSRGQFLDYTGSKIGPQIFNPADFPALTSISSPIFGPLSPLLGIAKVQFLDTLLIYQVVKALSHQRKYSDWVRAVACSKHLAKCKELLGCSSRWARELTKGARESAKLERDARITDLAAEGKSQREIAAEVGINQSTVARELDAKRNSAETHHQETLEDDLSEFAALTEQPEQQEPPKSRGVGVRYARCDAL